MSEYMRRIKLAHLNGVIPKGKVMDVEVAHDSTCPHLLASGECTCDPRITLRDLPSGKILGRIAADGTLRRKRWA